MAAWIAGVGLIVGLMALTLVPAVVVLALTLVFGASLFNAILTALIVGAAGWVAYTAFADHR